jgi:hypothetical protein
MGGLIMENNQPQKVGAGILTVSIIQLVFSGFVFIGLLLAFLVKDQIEAAGTVEITTSVLAISTVFTAITIIGIILILMKKQLGVYIYFGSFAINIIYSIVTNGFKASIILSLIIPVLMGIFIWQKKEVFGMGVKAEDINM